MKNIIFGLFVSLAAVVAAANESPYKGQEAREIKALSQQEIDGYLNGGGLGYAKAAELNGYPGPRHVLDLAEELALTEAQMDQTEAIYQAMKAQASTLGKQLLEKESVLDRQFAERAINRESLSSLVSDIATLQGEVRRVHLAAHLEQAALLTERQVDVYSKLRGYTNSTGHHQHSH